MVRPRLALAQECVVDLWESRDDGRFEALERALIDLLGPKKKNENPTPPALAPSNVICLADRVVARRRRRKA